MIHSVCDPSVPSSAPNDTRVGGLQIVSNRIALTCPRACLVTRCPATLRSALRRATGVPLGGALGGSWRGVLRAWPRGWSVASQTDGADGQFSPAQRLDIPCSWRQGAASAL